MINKKNKMLICSMFAVGTLLSFPALAQNHTEDNFGTQNVEAIDASYVDVCVSTTYGEQGQTEVKEVINRNACDENKEKSQLYYYKLYPDVPTFVKPLGEKPHHGFFHIPEEAKSHPAELNHIYQTSLDTVASYKDANTVNDSNLMYYKIHVNNERKRTPSGEEGSRPLYIPLYSQQKQLIPSIGDWVSEQYTDGIIDTNDVPSDVNIEFVNAHSVEAPEEGIESAINTASEKDYATSNEKKGEQPSSQPSPAPEPDVEPKPEAEPVTFADFKWLIIFLGVGVGVALLVFSFTRGSEAIRKKKKRDAEEAQQRRKREEELNYKKRLWQEAINQIDDTMADYGQKNADIGNKTLFYPLIDDITHPLHVKFLREMQQVEGFKEMSFNENRLDDLQEFSRTLSDTWREFFGTAQEIGIPWVKTQEDKERAKKLLNLVLNDGATESERETARDNLIKHIDKLFAEEQENQSGFINSMRSKNTVYDKYNVKPNNLKVSISRSLSKPLNEISQKSQLAIEGGNRP